MNNNITSENAVSDFLGVVENILPSYRFDQYRLYPSTDRNVWQVYLIKRLNDHFQSKDSYCFFEVVNNLPFLIGCQISRWDEEHFGFKMANINWVIAPEDTTSNKVTDNLVNSCISFLRDEGVRFVSSRICSDDTQMLHLFGDKGFRYYESTVYPIAKCADLSLPVDTSVRLATNADLDDISRIAEQHQYQRGHYYCDVMFDNKRVDTMYVKWIRTSIENNEPIAVFVDKGKVTGYFAFVLDEELSKFTGYKYGRMTSLAMDTSIRGKGFGMQFFQGVIALLTEMGVRYIASEYATKNIVSTRLHMKNLFYPLHEKVLFHLWLIPIHL